MAHMAEPGVRTRGHKKKERTRRRLIRAAIDVIAAQGEAFTVSDVANRADVANGTFYNYFPDRDALTDAVATEVLAGFAEGGAEAVDDADPACRFATITALAFEYSAAAPDTMRAMLRLEAVQRAVDATAVVQHLRADLKAGVESGRFTVTDVDATLDVVIGSTLMATRRVVNGEATVAYRRAVIAQLVTSLGVAPADAAVVAALAVDRASELIMADAATPANR